MSIEALRDLADRLGQSSRALAALGAAVQARVAGVPLDPAVRAQVAAVLEALGVRGEALERMAPAELRPLLGAIRTELFLGAGLLSGEAAGAGGWSATDPWVLQAAGDVSVGFPGTLRRRIAPRLEGLEERLAAPEARFLDVGVGVAAMAIEMVRQWPGLRVVGVDPWPAALALARENLRAAGLADRIELREGRAEDLREEGRFDLAWVPGAFIPEAALPAVLERVGRALRPGGWLLLAFARAPAEDPLAAALAGFRTALWGGTRLPPEALEALLARAAGLAEVRTLPGPPGAAIGLMAGRCPVAATAA